MTSLTMSWPLEALWEALSPAWPDLNLEAVPETGSTNTVLLERARGGDFAPALLVAEHQTAGRGRMGRVWVAQPGDTLTFSLALPFQRRDLSGLSLVVGVALARMLGGGVRLKWPNDLWIQDPDSTAPGGWSKLGGILIEAVQMGDQRQVVIGIGLNVRRAPLPNTQGVQVLDDRWTAPMLLQQSVLALVPALRRFDAEGFAPFRASFESLDLLRQQSLTTTLADLPSGIGAGVDMTGALQLLTPDGLKTVHSGEVSVRPC